MTNTKNKTSKMVNSSSPRRDSKGRFATTSIVPGRLYAWTKNGRTLIIRAKKELQNHVFLVNFHKNLWGMARSSELSLVDKGAVESYLREAK